jgi:hypothetical protein
MPRLTLRALALTCSLLAPACADGAQIPEVRAAYDRVVEALERADADALWALSHPDARRPLLELARDAARASSAARDLWGPPERPEGARAQAALGGSAAAQGDSALPAILGSGSIDAPPPEAGPRLIRFFLDFKSLTWNEGSRESVSLARMALDEGTPDLAVVRIPSGESMAFRTHEGEWRTLLLRDLVLDSERFKTLRANIDRTLALAEEQSAATRTSLDAATPQGVWNLVRRELSKGASAAPLVFRLLDEPARKTLKDALEAGRAAQRRIQQRVARPGRDAAYAAAGLADHVAARSDLELFERWYAAHPFAATLAGDLPDRFERDGADRGTLVTASGARIPMARDAGGTWALSGLTEALRADLVTRVQPTEQPSTGPGEAPPASPAAAQPASATP